MGTVTTSRNNWPCCSFAEPLDMEDLSSGLGVTKPDLVQGKAPPEGTQSPVGPTPLWVDGQHSTILAHSPGPSLMLLQR